MDFAQAYVEKVCRDSQAAQFVSSIRDPRSQPLIAQIDAADLGALAMAIERCTPDEIALWMKWLLDGAVDDYSADDGETQSTLRLASPHGSGASMTRLMRSRRTPERNSR